MQLRIALTDLEPPQGTVSLDGSDEGLRFGGWLELISAVERLVQAELDASRSTSDRPSPHDRDAAHMDRGIGGDDAGRHEAADA